MIDIKLLRKQPEIYKKAALDKGISFDFERFLLLDQQLLKLQKVIEGTNVKKAMLKKLLQDIKKLGEDFDGVISQIQTLQKNLDMFSQKYKVISQEHGDLLSLIPNLVLDNVPFGYGYQSNLILETVEFPENSCFSVDLGQSLDLYVSEKLHKKGFNLTDISGNALLEAYTATNFLDNQLPLRYVCNSTDSLEIISFVLSHDASKEYELHLSVCQEILKDMSISHRILDVCSGDLPFSCAKKYSIEISLPAFGGHYKELFSCEHYTDFLARKHNIKSLYDGKKCFVHILCTKICM